MKRLLFGLLCGAVLGCNEGSRPGSVAGGAIEKPTPVTANRPKTSDGSTATSEPLSRNNTGVNIRDRASSAKTPIDQNENKTDIRITADIRKQVVATDMSVDAHNVKIITQDGVVTLRGPVKSDGERLSIEKIAVAIAGQGKVDNQLEVTLP